jgi:glycine/sarcosine N-methyltransferase
MNSAEQYDTFAADYHWLYSDYGLSGARTLAENDDVLTAAGSGAALLDCACGIGISTIALARRGYAVCGSDGSRGMIDQALLASGKAEVNVPFKQCSWADLPDQFAERFDLVFCLGNAIGHLHGREEMVRSLCGMRAVLRDGGKLVLDSRNWELIRRVRARFTHYPWRERAGQRCLPIHVWNFPESFDEAHTIEVTFVFDSGSDASIRSYPVVYYPYRFEELAERLRSAGFSKIQTDFREEQPAYRVIAA